MTSRTALTPSAVYSGVAATICQRPTATMDGMSDAESELYATDAVSSGPETRAVVSTTKIAAGDLTDEHVGKSIGFHDDRMQLSIPAQILRIEHREGPPPNVLIWLRCPPQVVELGLLPKRDDFLCVAPWYKVQLVDAITF